MAIPFLNNINLSDNQLLNAKLQVTSTAPTAAVGQIYFDSTVADETAKYYSNATDTWVSLKEYSFPAVAKADGYITSTITGTTPKPIVKFNLNATGTADNTTYLRGDNQWEPISAIPGTYTWDVSDGTNTDTVGSGFELIFAGTGGTTTSYNSGNRTLTIDSGNETITLTGEVTGSGTTSISTTVANGVLDVANFNASAIVIESEGIENNDNDTTLPTSAAVKAYVDSSVAGGLIYQGGYNAATNTPDLTTSPNSILKGWTYTVTADGTFFGEQLRIGDVLIAEQDNPSALTDWTTVQNNIDLADLTTVGIGNVNIDGAGNKDGLSLAYASGTATVGLNITDLPNLSIAITAADLASLEIPLYNGDNSSANEKIEVATLLSAASSQISYATTITDTATISHGLASSDVMVQLYDITTGETVYADVDRISTTQVTITFAATPTNSVRVLVQKIG